MQRTFVFGPFRLEPGTEILLRGTEPMSLGRRAVALLRALLERPGALVSKDALIDAAWPGLAIEDSNLSVQIAALRRALGEVPGGGRWIETMPRRGYRFVGPVGTGMEAGVIESRSALASLGPAPKANDVEIDGCEELDRASLDAAPPSLRASPSIAVLPFQNMSGESGQEYFVDGVVEEIITALSRIRWLVVHARNSSFTYRGQAIDVKRVGRELGVRYVLEGSVRKAGNRVRITGQLIDATSGAHLWADRFDGSLEDIFDLQDKVASSVAGIIEPTLQTAETARSASRPTADLTAYDLYLRADAMYVSSAARIPEALNLLEQAIARDPDYGAALALAAVCCVRLRVDYRSKDPEADARKGADFARRALEVASDHPGILANAASALAFFGEDIGVVMAIVDRALALNPNYARGWHNSGTIRLFAGQPDIAIEHFETALRLSPRARIGTTLSQIGMAHFVSRRFDRAVAKLLIAIRDDPSDPPPYLFLAASYAHMGRLNDAREIIERLRGIVPFVMPVRTTLRNPDHRELLLSGLRIAAGELPSAASAPLEPAPPPHADAEHRQITVLSCELTGAQRADDIGLEALREAASDFRSVVGESAKQHAGRVVGRVGNTEFVLFGYPKAHEDDAEQAVRAGLELVAARGASGTRADAPLRCRVGIATGMAVIGQCDRGDEARGLEIVGTVPNLASQLRLSAQPGMVAIESTTRNLIGTLFDCRNLGSIGTIDPLPTWQVIATKSGESRFEALRPGVLTPLVGRDEEIGLLSRRWDRAKAGDGQVVLISGEPGVGKSRISAEFEARLRCDPHLRLRYSCSPSHLDSALFPFISELAEAAEFARDDTPATRLAKLEAHLADIGLPGEDMALLGELLSLPASDRHPLPDLSPQSKRERVREALLRQLESNARQQPLVLVFEDAHWIDATSRELLDLLVERVRRLPVLLLVTFRPEFQAPWIGHPHVTALTLSRLDHRDQLALIAHLAAGKALPNEVIAQLAERTDGVPLFVEELTKTVLESGLLSEEADRYVLVRPLSPFAIPTSLHSALLARLDRLPSARNAAQIGAVIGREFSYTLLRAVSPQSEEALEASLGRLVASELVFQRGTPPDAIYSFKHALVQEATRSTLLRSARQQLHANVATALEAESPEMVESQPELLAQHYTDAGLIEKSVAFWRKAGDRSAARSAMVETAVQFQKGLDQLMLLPDNTDRQQQELGLLKGLGAALQSINGYGAPETGQTFARAQKLWEQLGSPSEFLQIPYGQSRHHTARGELDRAQLLAEDLLRLSQQRDDSCGLVLAHLAAGRNQFIGGKFSPARSHLEEVLLLYDPIAHRPLADQTGTHLHVVAQAHLALVLFGLGVPDQAMAQSSAAIAEARRLAHPASLAASLTLGNLLLSLVGDSVALEERARQLVAVGTEQGFPFRRAMGTISHGWVKVKNGEVAAGMSLLRSGLAAYRATGAEVWVPYYVALLAGACKITGKIDEGLALLDEALQVVERTGERWFEAELYRHKGQLLLLQGSADAAEGLYRRALSIALDQEAKLWELRAAVSLARLRRDQSRRGEARELLARVYGWFSEGFTTPDNKEAATLLAELA